MATKKKALQAAAGAAAGGEFLAIEDVFSTYLYTGNGSTQTITNDIDLAGEGGLVWIKTRSHAVEPILVDTERGATKYLSTDRTAAEGTNADIVNAFNSDGFSFGGSSFVNTSGRTYASWTFRKAPRFFDVVTYTGDDVAGRTVSHNLGVQPGMIVVKSITAPVLPGSWGVYHRSNGAFPEYNNLFLNNTNASDNNINFWYNTPPTDTEFTVGAGFSVNESGVQYVAYLFAHDPLGPSEDGSDGLIACGSYTGNGSADGPEIDLGWEPQWVIIKRSDSTAGWVIFDVMRGMAVGGNDALLQPNTSDAENNTLNAIAPQSSGFQIESSAGTYNASGGTYIYIAIRRGPMRVPESGTEVFAVSQPADTARATTIPFFEAGFAPDAAIDRFNKNSTFGQRFSSRMTGPVYMFTNATDAEASNVYHDYNTYMDGYYTNLGTAQGGDDVAWMFRRAPGFFDVVAYTGTGANRTVPHNLGVAPEFIIVKQRASGGTNWRCYHSANGATNGIALNLDLQSFASTLYWNDTSPTSSVFTVGTSTQVNASGGTYIAYLFATLAGISKVGSYTGNGSNQTINCGFTTGARFILIKRTDSTGDWYVWDTARGIVTGNDPFLELNTTDAEVTSDDSIDPDSSGFIVNQTATTNVNVSSASYIFLAIS
jgi:hypothetical protein